MDGDSGAKELEYLKFRRKYVRSEATKRINSVQTNISNFYHQKCLNEIKFLNELKDRLQKSNDEISRLIWMHITDLTAQEAEFDGCSNYDNAIIDCLSILESKLGEFVMPVQPQVANPSNVSLGTSCSRLTLPKVSLPKYSNSDNEDFESFITRFETIISKHSLGEYEKFVLLSEQLSKEPLALVSSLRGAQQSYTEAKSLLKKAFASPMRQKEDIISRLGRLNLSNNGEIYTFISEYRVITHTLKELNVSVDDIVRHFV